MSPADLAMSGLWSALVAVSLAVFWTVPPRALWIAALAGFGGTVLRGVALALHGDLVLASFVAALAVTAVSLALAPRRHVSTIVAISALIPIGASLYAFRAVELALRIAAEPKDANVPQLQAALNADMTTLLTVTGALALGFAIPWLLTREQRTPNRRA